MCIKKKCDKFLTLTPNIHLATLPQLNASFKLHYQNLLLYSWLDQLCTKKAAPPTAPRHKNTSRKKFNA